MQNGTYGDGSNAMASNKPKSRPTRKGQNQLVQYSTGTGTVARALQVLVQLVSVRGNLRPRIAQCISKIQGQADVVDVDREPD